MNSLNKTVQSHSFNSIFKGLVYSFVSLGILTFVVSLLLLLTNMKEQSMSTLIYFVHGISLLIGGFITGKRIEKKGWYYGGILGIVYCVIIVLIGMLGFQSSLDLVTLILLILTFSAGALGGIIGVNTRQ